MRNFTIFGVLLVCCAGILPAQQAGNLTPPPMPRVQAEIYDRVTSRVLAPCCWSQPVQIHQSPEADKVRAEIVSLLREGRGEQDIFNSLALEYGERILGEPRGARGLVAYVTPYAILLIALAGLGLGLSRMSKRRRPLFAHSGPLPDVPEFDL